MQCENRSHLHIRKMFDDCQVRPTPVCTLREAQPGQPVFPSSYLSISALWLGLVMAAIYCMMYLLASVLPAPLSPGGKNYEGINTIR